MAFKIGTGVFSPAFGTGTVIESNDEKTKVRFDKDDAEKTLLNKYLQHSEHELKIRVKLIETIELTLDDLFQLERLTLKRRADCWASFSVNAMNDIWIFVTRGWTERKKRKYIQGQCRAIERIAELCLSERFEGGRVLLTSEGAKYRTNAPKPTRSQREDIPFARFKLPENWITEGPISFRPPQPAIYAPYEVETRPPKPEDGAPSA
jgi:hypothetical protein